MIFVTAMGAKVPGDCFRATDFLLHHTTTSYRERARDVFERWAENFVLLTMKMSNLGFNGSSRVKHTSIVVIFSPLSNPQFNGWHRYRPPLWVLDYLLLSGLYLKNFKQALDHKSLLLSSHIRKRWSSMVNFGFCGEKIRRKLWREKQNHGKHY